MSTDVLYAVRANKPIKYDLVKTSNLFSHRNLSLLAFRDHRNSGCAVVIMDCAVYDLLEDECRSYYAHHGIDLNLVRLDSNEVNKNFDSYNQVVMAIESVPLHRRGEPVIAIGGGVVMDIVGFVCATYRRSIPCIKVPTTLMGYVDASIGIKNGIDYNGNKNRIGTFEPPLQVILDKGFLATLPHRHLVNGLGEIIKIALIRDPRLYSLLKTDGKKALLSNFQEAGDEILDLSIVGLLQELEGNLYEVDLKRPSDFGHTFSLVLEMANINTLLHGEAVSIDIAITCVIAAHRKLITYEFLDQTLELMGKLGLPTYHPSLTTEMLMKGLVERTLHRNGDQNVPVPSNGDELCVFLQDITADDISHAIAYLK